jgi:hypothetical protein
MAGCALALELRFGGLPSLLTFLVAQESAARCGFVEAQDLTLQT